MERTTKVLSFQLNDLNRPSMEYIDIFQCQNKLSQNYFLFSHFHFVKELFGFITLQWQKFFLMNFSTDIIDIAAIALVPRTFSNNKSADLWVLTFWKVSLGGSAFSSHSETDLLALLLFSFNSFSFVLKGRSNTWKEHPQSVRQLEFHLR